MGNLISSIFDRIVQGLKDHEARILMLGLDAAGKTTILYNLKLGEVVTTIPTIGFNVEEIKYKSLTLRVWDVGGQDRIRILWRHYFKNSNALIYVVDSADPERIRESMEELQKCLTDPTLAGIPVLIYANKQDLPNSLSVQEIAKRFSSIPEMQERKWFVQPTIGTSGEGLYEGIDWLAYKLR
eukprot:GEZU01000482.1.p1 GENE.GEZU01000482.1~~GEZU01000482.1.p1  ORF type:complete len:183 (+),score=46.47 GEZU01000482.1:152-700(+)